MPTRTPDDPAIVDSTAALASLYQAPFAGFVARRSDLVAQLKRSGHKDVAARIASAGKPSRAAYLVNQVYWRNRSVYDGVLETGTAARAAQQARLLGDAAADLADTMQARDAAIRAAVAQAEQIAADDGQPASESVRSQVRASFEALAAHGLEGRLPHGQLTADVELPGLAALAGLMLPSAAPAPVRKFEVVARRAEPAPPTEPEPPPPDPRVLELEARLADLLAREQASQERLADLERALSAATEVLTEAEAAAAEAERRVASARQAVERGAQSRDAAQAEITRLAADLEAGQRELASLQAGDADLAKQTSATRSSARPRKPAPTPAPRAPGPRRPRR